MDDNIVSILASDIDRCINSKKEYDYAVLIFKCLGHKYYYDNNWYFKNTKELDSKNETLSYDIQHYITDIFLKRSTFWENQKNLEQDNNLKSDYELKSNLLIKTANKLKTNPLFVKSIIKECKGFFIIKE